MYGILLQYFDTVYVWKWSFLYFYYTVAVFLSYGNFLIWFVRCYRSLFGLEVELLFHVLGNGLHVAEMMLQKVISWFRKKMRPFRSQFDYKREVF